MTELIRDLIRANRADGHHTLPSVCSTQPEVLTAALLLARDLKRPVLVESTSNQVNQFGGYTGMTPAAFMDSLRNLARELRFDPQLLVLGGDHLGPQAWRHESAVVAMGHAKDMVRAYVLAGYTKIHLDCSEACAGDPQPIAPSLCAVRAAELAAECERVASAPLTYVIGTEVPRPGGALADEEHLRPTRWQDAAGVIELHRDAFAKIAPQAWERVAALVVQPGVDFSPTHVVDFDADACIDLDRALTPYPHMCFEAHSTDYQPAGVYEALAARHFAILKVGPALTDAYRRAVYALDDLSEALGVRGARPRVCEVMESLMVAEPSHWRSHYRGTAAELRWLRHHSYADRIRYYWPRKSAIELVAALLRQIDAAHPPRYVLRDYFDAASIERAASLASETGSIARALVLASIQAALLPYFGLPTSR
jgi:D-tagatose-bisphosphate aldolase class II non-catalytic subunit